MYFSVYYDGNTPESFTQALDENVIIPKMSMIRLISAFIPHLKQIVIFNDGAGNRNDQVKWKANNDTEVIYAIPVGTYTIQALANNIETGIRAQITANPVYNNIDFDAIRVGSGHDAKSIQFKMSANTFAINIDQILKWGTENFNANLKQHRKAGLLNANSVSAGSENGGIYRLGQAVIEDTTDSATDSLASGWFFDEEWKLNWCSEHTQSVDLNYPPNTQSHPHNYLYGAIQWINKAGDGGAQKAYYVGITAEGKQPTMGNIAANGDIGQYVNLDEVLVLVMVIGDTAYPAGGGTNSSAQAFLANRAYAFERKDTSANFVLVKQFSQTIADGDIIALSLVGNGSGTAPKSIEYYYRANGSNEYQQEIVPSVVRYQHTGDESLSITGGFYEASTEPVIHSLKATLDSTNVDTSEWGHNISFALSGGGNNKLFNTLGFKDETYTKNTDGSNKFASIDIMNENRVNIQEAGTQTSPYINVNLSNLPIRSMANENTAGLGLTTSKTIASIARFNDSGDMDSPKNYVFDGTFNESIPMNNLQDYPLNQLSIDLKNSDGSKPNDIDTPIGLNFVILPQK